MIYWQLLSLQWRHNDHDGVTNHQPHGCLLNRLFRRRSKKTSKLRVTGLCVGNSPGPANSPHKGPVTRKMCPFDDVIMLERVWPPCITFTITSNVIQSNTIDMSQSLRKDPWSCMNKPLIDIVQDIVLITQKLGVYSFNLHCIDTLVTCPIKTVPSLCFRFWLYRH